MTLYTITENCIYEIKYCHSVNTCFLCLLSRNNQSSTFDLIPIYKMQKNVEKFEFRGHGLRITVGKDAVYRLNGSRDPGRQLARYQALSLQRQVSRSMSKLFLLRDRTSVCKACCLPHVWRKAPVVWADSPPRRRPCRGRWRSPASARGVRTRPTRCATRAARRWTTTRTAGGWRLYERI